LIPPSNSNNILKKLAKIIQKEVKTMKEDLLQILSEQARDEGRQYSLAVR
jgi:hypothetical protein